MQLKQNRMILSLLLGLLVVPLLSCNTAPPEPVKVELAVTGMTCATCENAITAQLLKQEGVTAATASHVAESVSVEFSPGEISEDKIVNTIESLNFDVVDAGTTPGSE